MVTKFHDQPKSQNPTYCLLFLSELTVSIINALLNILQALLAPYKKVNNFIVMACLTFY